MSAKTITNLLRNNISKTLFPKSLSVTSKFCQNINYSNSRSISTQIENSQNQTFSPETINLVEKLRNQLKYYATVEVKGRKFTVTLGDTIILNKQKDLQVGDKLKLNLVKELGSKDFSIIGKPYVNEKYYDIEATVVEQHQGPEFDIIKFKKRKGYKRHYLYRNYYTLVKVHKLEVNQLG